MRFFPERELIATFPPILASTIERSVVGITLHEIPRRIVAATKPAKSETAPPPITTKWAFL